MIPLRDINPSERFPVINNGIIVITVLAFVFELLQGPRLKEFLYLYGLVPARYAEAQIAAHVATSQQVLPFSRRCSCMVDFCISWVICGSSTFLGTM
jgi:rhomboid family protein